MPATRSSARLASKTGSSPSTSPASAAGMKRKTQTGSSPAAKRGKKTDGNEQKKLEETVAPKYGSPATVLNHSFDPDILTEMRKLKCQLSRMVVMGPMLTLR